MRFIQRFFHVQRIKNYIGLLQYQHSWFFALVADATIVAATENCSLAEIKFTSRPSGAAFVSQFGAVKMAFYARFGPKKYGSFFYFP